MNEERNEGRGHQEGEVRDAKPPVPPRSPVVEREQPNAQQARRHHRGDVRLDG
jgi:hypothetical protein